MTSSKQGKQADKPGWDGFLLHGGLALPLQGMLTAVLSGQPPSLGHSRHGW